MPRSRTTHVNYMVAGGQKDTLSKGMRECLARLYANCSASEGIHRSDCPPLVVLHGSATFCFCCLHRFLGSKAPVNLRDAALGLFWRGRWV